MDKRELERLEKDLLDDASSSLAASMEYLGGMIRYFESDTRTFQKLAADSMLDLAKAGFKDGEEYSKWQTFMRALVRAAFAEVEGVTTAMKQVVLWAYHRGEYAMSEIEHANLSEKHRYNTCKDNLSLAFKHFAALFDSPYTLDKQSRGWSAFLRSIKIRDGLTHPRSPFGFQLSGDAANDIRETVQWLGETFWELMESCPNIQASEI